MEVSSTLDFLLPIFDAISPSVWAATTRNQDYIKMQGLKCVISMPDHRKEFVAGNLQEYCTCGMWRLADDAHDTQYIVQHSRKPLK